MNADGPDRIKAGTQSFAIDQQPWLQGFLAVTLADAYVNYGLKLASAPILTGPGVVDKDSIDATLAGTRRAIVKMASTLRSAPGEILLGRT